MVLRASDLNYNTYRHEMAAVGCRVTTAVAIVTEDVFGNAVAPPSKVMTIALGAALARRLGFPPRLATF
jgi:hypothetical protein